MAHMKKEVSAKRKRDGTAIQKDWCTYLLLNCIFLFPVLLITEFPDRVYAIFSVIPELIGMVFFLPYWLLVILYYLFRLMYLHFAVSLGFLGFSVYCLIKEKNWKQFFVILLLTILSAVLNYYWLMHGGPYTVV
ncbi:MAG: hypothetical protein K2O32_15565 [Acetatifactor sp.]|nr:hypothetical protein [Acetatifactor sp.]